MCATLSRIFIYLEYSINANSKYLTVHYNNLNTKTSVICIHKITIADIFLLIKWNKNVIKCRIVLTGLTWAVNSFFSTVFFSRERDIHLHFLALSHLHADKNGGNTISPRHVLVMQYVLLICLLIGTQDLS